MAILIKKPTLVQLVNFSKGVIKGNIRYNSKESILQINEIRNCLTELAKLSITDKNCANAVSLLTKPSRNGTPPLKILVDTNPNIINKIDKLKVVKRIKS